MAKETNNWMEKATKVFAVLAIYLMIGMVFSAAVFADPEDPSTTNKKDLYSQASFWEQPITWNNIDMGLIPKEIWGTEGLIRQEEIPTDMIKDIPAEFVKVLEVDDPFFLGEDQLTYDGNYEKLDLGKLNPIEIGNVLNNEFGIKDASWVLIEGTSIQDGVMKIAGECSTVFGTSCVNEIDLKKNAAELENAVIQGVTYEDQGQTFKGFVICTKDGN